MKLLTNIIMNLIIFLLTFLTFHFLYGLDYIYPYLSLIVAGLASLINFTLTAFNIINTDKKIEERKKEKERLKELQKQLEKKDTKLLTEVLDNNKEQSKAIKKVIDKRRDEWGFKRILNKFIVDIIIFSPVILFLGIMLLGSLGSIYHLPKETFMQNASVSINMISNITLNKFYDIGYSRPQTFFWVFYIACFLAFILPTIMFIYRLIKLYRRKKK